MWKWFRLGENAQSEGRLGSFFSVAEHISKPNRNFNVDFKKDRPVREKKSKT